MSRLLALTLLQGRDLKAADVGGTSDPYCVVFLNNEKKKKKTLVRQSTLSPIWNHRFVFSSSNPSSDVLNIRLYDKDMLIDQDIGLIKIPVSSIGEEGGVKWFKVEKGTGQIRIKFEWVASEEHKPGDLGVEYKVHINSVAGTVVASKGDSLFMKFPTYEVYLKAVPNVFENTFQSWNEKYAKAKQIFGDDAAAMLLRTSIKAQHASLYREGLLRTDSGYLTDGEQFLGLINYGIRENRKRFYTYVITNDRIFFAETGATTMKDFFSKHAMHANAEKQVRYAGEFFIHGEPGKEKLVIDNNSGTYAPKKDHLPLVEKVFKHHFPDIQIEVLDFNDPQFKEYQKFKHL
eukprot:TRINITY_DN3946_c0_g2_i1.p1 TRINITY_DN3946_c0_g2~~TRINITY_DN3946_c0_g2_i1.p1  ORF type:complete len:356 (-),score=57.55 TRINITY_DN3946_c0_g2_i1:45-1085(-)